MKTTILETILDPRALSVCFQPIFRRRGKDQSVDSVEALVRGPRDTKFARADILFDYVRRKRAELAVDQSCLTAICNAAMGLPENLRININVHASTLGQRSGFVEFFSQQAKKRGFPLERFTLEIVEHAPTCNIPQLAGSIADLRAAGVRIALDDVGLGQSNYRMMLDCHPNYFKLDAYFVRGVSDDPKRRAVVESLVALAKALESEVVAEGACQEDLPLLEASGVTLVQANILCPALPLEKLQEAGHLGEAHRLATAVAVGAANRAISDFEHRRMLMQVVGGNSFYT